MKWDINAFILLKEEEETAESLWSSDEEAEGAPKQRKVESAPSLSHAHDKDKHKPTIESSTGAAQQVTLSNYSHHHRHMN